MVYWKLFTTTLNCKQTQWHRMEMSVLYFNKLYAQRTLRYIMLDHCRMSSGNSLKGHARRLTCQKHSTALNRLASHNFCKHLRIHFILLKYEKNTWNHTRSICNSSKCSQTFNLKDLDENTDNEKQKGIHRVARWIAYYISTPILLIVSGCIAYEVFYWETPTNVFLKAKSKCLNNEQLKKELGGKLTAFGDPQKDFEIRNFKYNKFEKDGAQYMTLEMNVKGQKSAKVHVEVRKNNDRWDFVVISATLDDDPNKVIIVEDNRDTALSQNT